MHKQNKNIALLAAVTLLILSLAGCGPKEEEFTDSAGIMDNGRWEGLNALENVTLCEYEGIAVPAETHEISIDAVQAQIEELASQFITTEEVTDRSVQDGDTVNIDYVGSVDGVEFDGGNTQGAGADVTIGYTSYIDDFLEQLIGHMPGETFNVEVTFPEDYGTEEAGNAHLNGKDAVFVTTINHIVEYIDPVVDDLFVQENFSEAKGWTTVLDMQEGIRDDLRTAAVSAYLQEYIINNSTVITLPDSMLEYQEKSMLLYYEEYAAYYSMELEEFLPVYAGVANTAELLESSKESNTRTATFYLIIQAIAEELELEMKDADLRDYFAKYAGSEDYTQFKTQYGKPYLMMMVQAQNVLDHLQEKAVLQ
ncbi:MAG TPA: hypothetical protein DF480_00030 [Clostridiales bacterium]|nr:hypothetical protein [Clostridiales bacterium]